MKKILFLTNMYPSVESPSYGIFVKKTYDSLSEKYNVTLVKICKSRNLVHKIYQYVLFNVKSTLLGIFQDYDCIYAHYISHCCFPIRVIKFFKKDVIVVGNVHGEDVFSSFDEFKKNRIRAQHFIDRANYIIAPSLFFKGKLLKEYNVTEQQVFVSPSGGIDTELFCNKDKDMCKQQLKLDINKKYIGYVSRIEKGKGWDVFLYSVSELLKVNCDVNVLIVGDGTEKSDMMKLIMELGIEDKVILHPLLSQEELPLVYNSLEVFCFPSRIVAESLGLVGLEAMSCAVPCVITNLGGPSSYAEDAYNCVQFSPEDVNDLIEKIVMLLEMTEEQRYILINNARNTALLYDKKNVEMEFMSFFDKIISTKETC